MTHTKPRKLIVETSIWLRMEEFLYLKRGRVSNNNNNSTFRKLKHAHNCFVPDTAKFKKNRYTKRGARFYEKHALNGLKSLGAFLKGADSSIWSLDILALTPLVLLLSTARIRRAARARPKLAGKKPERGARRSGRKDRAGRMWLESKTRANKLVRSHTAPSSTDERKG